MGLQWRWRSERFRFLAEIAVAFAVNGFVVGTAVWVFLGPIAALGTVTALTALLLVVTGALTTRRRVDWRLDGVRAVSDGVVIRGFEPADGDHAAATIDERVVADNGWTAQIERRWRSVLHSSCDVDHLGLHVVCLGDDSRPVGVLTLPARWQTSVPVVGLWVESERRSRGVESAALRAVATALGRNGFERVAILVAASDAVGRRAAEAAGGVVVAETPHRLPNGDTVDSVWYELQAPSVSSISPPAGRPG